MLQGVVDQANAFVRGTTPEEEMRKRLGAERNDRRYSVLDQDHTKSDAFKEWFGDWENDPEHASKVVDENGRPTNSEYIGGVADYIQLTLREKGILK